MTPRISLEAALSPQGAHVLRSVDHAGRTLRAQLDLDGLPRVDACLLGRPVAEVPRIVERLCGICPVAHHLAGLRALEALSGVKQLPSAAVAVRRLLHYGSTVDQLALRLVQLGVAACMPLRKVGRAAMAAAGSPGHFPTTGVPGGVAQAANPQALLALAEQAREALEVATELLRLAREHSRLAAAKGAADAQLVEAFDGLEVCLVDASGHPDLLGERLRAITASGQVVLAGATPSQWPELVTESRPGDVAPRPLLHLPGSPEAGNRYRVGPVSQLRVGALPTPLAATAQQQWLETAPDVVVARAVLLLHALEVVAELAAQPEACNGPLDLGALPTPGAGRGTGWVESPRGLLVHSYQADETGTLVAAQILTPTAQNEPWLAALLAQAGSDQQRMEQAIQEADPCLPCVSAPEGMMDLTVTTLDSEA